MNKDITLVLGLVIIFLIALTGCTETQTENALPQTPSGEQQEETQNLKPVAIINVDKTSGDAPLTVTFDGSQSYDPDGEIVNYTWYFPAELDKRQKIENSTRYGKTVSHTFFESGKKIVELRVIDNNGSSAWAEINITVNEAPQLGSRMNPAPIGTSLIYNVTDSWLYGDYSVKITVLQVIRGSQAWQMIHDANMFNDPPEQGYEYILAKIRFEYLWNSDPNQDIDISQYSFDVFSEDGVKYDEPIIVAPDPQLSTTLYPGGIKEGWGAYQVAIDDEHPLLVYDQIHGGVWFKLYY